jgi:hypothetical protein
MTWSAPPPSTSSSETAWVKVSRVACEEEMVSGVPSCEKMAEAPALSGMASANASLQANGGHVNEVGP